MSRKSAADQPAPPEATADAPPKPVLKSQAMDAALAAGMATPAEGAAYVLEHFGIEVSGKQFSTHKSLAKQKASIDARLKAPKPAAKPTPPAPAPAQAPEARPPAAAHQAQPELADAVQAIKGLVEALGVEQVKRIAGLFGK